MQLLHMNVLLHVPVIAYEQSKVYRLIPFFVIFTACHIALLIISGIPSLGCFCKEDAVFRKKRLDLTFNSTSFPHALLS